MRLRIEDCREKAHPPSLNLRRDGKGPREDFPFAFCAFLRLKTPSICVPSCGLLSAGCTPDSAALRPNPAFRPIPRCSLFPSACCSPVLTRDRIAYKRKVSRAETKYYTGRAQDRILHDLGRARGTYLFGRRLAALRGAGFQTCCVADFQVGITALPPAGLETRDTADLEVCVTLNGYRTADMPCQEGEDFCPALTLQRFKRLLAGCAWAAGRPLAPGSRRGEDQINQDIRTTLRFEPEWRLPAISSQCCQKAREPKMGL
jgi:hypothetical protein